MKKLLILGFASFVLFAGAPAAHAQSSVNQHEFKWAADFLLPPAAGFSCNYDGDGKIVVTDTNGTKVSGSTCTPYPLSSATTYVTSSACQQAFNTASDPKYPGRTLVLTSPLHVTCACDRPLGAQPSCVGYDGSLNTAPKAPDIAAPTAPDASMPTFNVASPDVTFVPLAPIPGLDGPNDNLSPGNGIGTFLNNLYIYLIGIAAILAIIEIIWGGLEISTKDSVSKNRDGKNRIWQALLGLALVLLPALVFGIINPSILRLDINMPNLDLANKYTSGIDVSGTGGSEDTNGASGPKVNTDQATGCTVAGTYYQKASCPTSAAAQAWVATTCTNNQRAVEARVLPCQNENSSGCVDKSYGAVCGLSIGPYIFIDTSQSGFSFSGVVNAIVGYSHYQPLAKSSTNPNNGADVLRFASTCVAEGGTVCLSDSTFSVSGPDCTYSSSQSTSQSNKCYSKGIQCKTPTTIRNATSCSTSPNFTVIE